MVPVRVCSRVTRSEACLPSKWRINFNAKAFPVKAILLLDSWAKAPLWWQKLTVLTKDSQRPLTVRARHLLSKMRNRFTEILAPREAPITKSDVPSPPALQPANVTFGEIDSGTFLELLRNIRKNYRYRRLDSL